MSVHQFIKTKFFRVTTQVLLWLTFITVFHIIHPVQAKYLIKFGILYNFVFIILAFYLNIHIFIPSFLSKKRFLLYIFILVLFTIITYFITHTLITLHDYVHVNFILPDESGNISNRLPMRSAVLVFITFALSTSITVTRQLFLNEEKRKEIEQQKIHSELAYLKSQINPHFLFNTLNSIYSLANKESKKSAEAIVKLSGLMRYILYESDNELVPLPDEINYIRDYIELQKLRIFDIVAITFSLHGNIDDHFIEPLLLIPIIENAFKHGVDNTTNSNINISVSISERDFVLHVENTIINANGENSETTGIGLSNLRKQLELLYPDGHSLMVTKEDKMFVVNLNLILKSNVEQNT